MSALLKKMLSNNIKVIFYPNNLCASKWWEHKSSRACSEHQDLFFQSIKGDKSSRKYLQKYLTESI